MTALLLAVFVMRTAPAAGSSNPLFCWDPVPEAVSYVLYGAPIGSVGEVACDPTSGLCEVRTVTAPPDWSQARHLRFDAACCDATECCVDVVEPDWPLVIYDVFAEGLP